MTMLTGVLDANAIIGLCLGGVFGLLPSLYTPMYLPPLVTAEVIASGSSRPGAAELAQALGVWITEDTPDPAAVSRFSTALSELIGRSSPWRRRGPRTKSSAATNNSCAKPIAMVSPACGPPRSLSS